MASATTPSGFEHWLKLTEWAKGYGLSTMGPNCRFDYTKHKPVLEVSANRPLSFVHDALVDWIIHAPFNVDRGRIFFRWDMIDEKSKLEFFYIPENNSACPKPH